MHPDRAPKASLIEQKLGAKKGVFVASSDYVKALPESISKYFPGRLHSLGTMGLAEVKEELHYEIFLK
ncbi:MAG: hypothetical protein R3A11_00220 [Bdellovibrionota bacterium]